MQMNTKPRVGKVSRIVLMLFLVFTILGVSQAKAAELSGVMFNDFYQEQGFNLRLQGLGLKTFFFFKAFVAGYYANSLKHQDPLGEFPKRIEVQYFVNIEGKKLNDFTLAQIKANIPPSGIEHIQNEIKLMAKYFVDLKPGDRFSLTYIPSIGTKFAHNGQLVGTIKGLDFAKAIFSVWIGKKPFDNQLKKQVLGLKK